jgi:hypothetical protein
VHLSERILHELAVLAHGGQEAMLVTAVNGGQQFVLYKDVPTTGGGPDTPHVTDVIVPVPDGYPAAPIDLAGLPIGSPFIPRVAGGGNVQGTFEVNGVLWQLASYHPHNNGGGPPWDQMKHGFHTYFGEILAWLARLS